MLGDKWKALSETDRKPYEDKAAADKKRYEDEKAKYQAVSAHLSPSIPQPHNPVNKSETGWR